MVGSASLHPPYAYGFYVKLSSPFSESYEHDAREAYEIG